jgi:hypothetical protein
LTPSQQPEATFAARVARLLGERPVVWRKVTGGYTPAARWVVSLESGRSAFVKAGTTPDTADWLRREGAFYQAVEAPFLPRFLAFEDDPGSPILVLEDLCEAAWPPPWDAERVERVLSILDAVAATPPPAGLPLLADSKPWLRDSWREVAANPQPFLFLGLCSDAWLADALPALIESQEAVDFGGEALLHLDVRSDNMCFAGSRTLLIDWNGARGGNPLFDVAFWLPSLQFEGGPPPDAVAPQAGKLAALVAGFFAARAGLPNIPDAPFVRRVQREQLSTALPWAARVLGLPPLDRPG